MEITQEFLKEKFVYKDGVLYWKKINHRMKGNYRLGTYNKKLNRHFARVNNIYTGCSRLIFLFHKGFLPVLVDHIDQNPCNDRIENLRPATKSQNSKNKKSRKGSSSKYLGVFFRCNRNSFVATIKIGNKYKYLGSFKNEEDAALAYNDAAIINHGEFASLNQIEKKTPPIRQGVLEL